MVREMSAENRNEFRLEKMIQFVRFCEGRFFPNRFAGEVPFGERIAMMACIGHGAVLFDREAV